MSALLSTSFSVTASMEVFASSHGRDLCLKIRRGVPNTNCIFKPNARFEQVIDGIERVPPGKVICIIGGTNNTHDASKDAKEILKDFNLGLVKRMAKTNPIILVQVLPRYDRPNLNKTIYKINSRVLRLLRHTKGVYPVYTNNLRQRHYTRHGLHLNESGKMILSYRICQMYRHIKAGNSERIGHLLEQLALADD